MYVCMLRCTVCSIKKKKKMYILLKFELGGLFELQEISQFQKVESQQTLELFT
jgi:hypothetical protein